jgi:hypothetical protein
MSTRRGGSALGARRAVHGHSRDSAERFGLRAPRHRHDFVADVEASIEDEAESDVDTGNGGGGASSVVIVEEGGGGACARRLPLGTRENLVSLGDFDSPLPLC